MEQDERIECRGPASLAALGGSLGCFGVVMALGGFGPATHPLTPPLYVAIAVLLCTIALGCFCVCAHSRLIADADGLRWRTWPGQWRNVPWTGVTDYYLSPCYQKVIRVIETTEGRLRLGVNDWSNLPRLQELVARKVMVPGVGGWALVGSRERDGDTEFTFRYTERTAWDVVVPSAFFAVGGTWMGIALAQRVLADVIPGAALVNPRLSELALLGLLLMLLLLGGGVVFCVRVLADWWPHRREIIHATAAALEWHSPSGSVRVEWPDVVAFGAARRGWPVQERYVRGRRGERIGFSPCIGRLVVLQSCIQARATAAERSRWPNDRSGEALGGEALRWRDGARVFHYRTRTTRAMLWLSGSVAAVSWSLPLLRAITASPEDAASPLGVAPVGVTLCMSLIFVWQLLCYYQAAVLVDEHGLTRVGVIGRTRLAWSDVRQYGARGSMQDSTLFVSGEHLTIRFNGLIADRELLQREITARAPHAEGAWPAPAESLPVTTP